MREEKIIDRSYGSIPHLSMSKLNQQADKKISEGQELILTKKTRDWRDLIIVTEKLDGSNVGVYKNDGILYTLTRSGYLAVSSKYKQHHLFNTWVFDNENLFNWLPDRWRVCGEWMIMAHGTKYDITNESPFVAFDIIDNNNIRINYIKFIKLCAKFGIQTTPLIHIGQPISINKALSLLMFGFYGKAEKPEGLVYKCERNQEFDFIAKYVRSDKEDGKYMKEEIYNEGWEYE